MQADSPNTNDSSLECAENNPKNSQKQLLEVGHAKHSFTLQIPIAAFVLALSISTLISILFYLETERLLIKQTNNEVSIESKLVEPIIEQFYNQAHSDILFLSKISPIENLIKSINETDGSSEHIEKHLIEKTFSDFLMNKDFYYQIRFIGLDNNGLELVNVRHEKNKIITPISRLQKKSDTVYFQKAIGKDLGHVHFSKIDFAKNNNKLAIPHKPTLRVSTPVFNQETGEVFGIIVINIDFFHFISALKNNKFTQLSFYLINEAGYFLSHPDNSKTFSFELNEQYLLQDQFPELKLATNKKLKEYSHNDIHIEEERFIGHFQPILLNRFDVEDQLSLLILKNRHNMEEQLASYRNRSLMLGGVFVFIALAFATFIARRITTPLKQITHSIENYELSSQLKALPINSNSEIGVLARSFNNLFSQTQIALQEQEHSILIAKQNSNKIKAIFSSAAEGFITINESGNIKTFNQAAQQMFAYTEQEVLEKNIKILMPENESGKHDSYLQNYKETGIASIIGAGKKLQGKKKTGEIFPIHLSISKINSEEGVVFTGIVRDISKEYQLEKEQEKSQQALMEVNERISLATDAAGIGIWQYQIINNTLTWDKWMHKLYETTEADFNGGIDDWQKSVHPEDIELANQAIKKAIDTKSNLDHNFRIITPDNQIKHLKAMAITKLNSEGEAIQMTGVNFDITERMVAEQEHIKAKELAEDAARHKAEFLASMSHEIRTPMNGILGMLGLLLRNDLNAEQMHRVQLANSSAEALLNLINDILDFSKVEAGKLDLEVIDFNLRKLFGEFSESLALKCQEKNIEMILDTRDIEMSHVKGDPGRIRQILNNLIGNAIKFTEHGEIVITAKIIKEANTEDDDSLTLHCSISDTGIGIDESKLSHLFKSFTQVDASTTRKYGGTGLGLAICKQLCQLMQGDIDVTSRLGEGSVFAFTIKLLASEQATIVVPNTDIKNVPLLIVDDNTTNRHILKSQLEHWGAIVYEAESGISALALLESNALDNPNGSIKMAFLDMNMPLMDGAELALNIKKNPRLKNIKLAMMTSMAARGDANYFKSIGFSAYFPKPTITKDILSALNLCLSEDGTLPKDMPLITHHFLKEVEHQAPFKLTNDNCHVLLVEDNRINQEVASHVLSEFGIKPDIANNGLEALKLLQESEGDNRYDIVLMDCQMPEMDGYQATMAIRQGQAGAENTDITIIAMTANAMKGDKEKCIASGMTDYLSKPIEPDLLKEKLCEYTDPSVQVKTTNQLDKHNELEGSVSQDNMNSSPTKVPVQGSSTKVSVAQELEKPDLPDEEVIWHRDAFNKRLNNNSIIQHKLIGLFLDEAPKQLEELAKSITQSDKEQQHALSHKLQGMTGNLSALALLAHTKEFNQYIKTDAPEESHMLELHQIMLNSYIDLERELKSALDESD